jgi:hypothetical protein
MLKKKFDGGNPPVIETSAVSKDILDDYKLSSDLAHAIEILNDSPDEDERMDILSAILVMANEVSQKDWQRGCDLALEHMVKVDAPFDDDLIMELVDIAMHDPQIEEMNKVIGVVRGDDFKKLAEIQEVEAAIPKGGALLLLKMAEGYAFHNSKVLPEIRSLRNAIDPSYTMPEGAGLDLH